MTEEQSQQFCDFGGGTGSHFPENLPQNVFEASGFSLITPCDLGEALCEDFLFATLVVTKELSESDLELDGITLRARCAAHRTAPG